MNGRGRGGPATGPSSAAVVGGLGPTGAPVTTASAEDLRELKRLAQIIVRMFYEDAPVMIVDQLVKFDVIPADKLADRLSVGVKDLKAQIQKLIDDRLVLVHIRAEQPPLNPNRPPPPPEVKLRPWKRPYYYLDLPTFFSIIKWRVSKIYKSIDSLTSSVAALTSRGFLCPRCGARYDSYDVNHLLDFETNKLRCEVPGCGEELTEDEDKETAKRKEDKMQRFNSQFGAIMAGLRRLEGIALPKINVDGWLLVNGPNIHWKAYDVNDPEIRELAGEKVPEDVKASRTKREYRDDDGIKVASGGNNATLGGLQVDVSAMLDPAAEQAKKKAAEEEARRKREQNALPEWHLKSTVSNQATSLGLEEEKRRQMLAGEDALMRADAAGKDGRQQANGADATAEYYAKLQYGDDEDEEEDEDDDAEAFEEVAAAGGDVPVPALPADTKKRAAEETPSSAAKEPESKKVKVEAPGMEATAVSASNPVEEDDEDEEEEEFEEV